MNRDLEGSAAEDKFPFPGLDMVLLGWWNSAEDTAAAAKSLIICRI